jgi:hypothetical protein
MAIIPQVPSRRVEPQRVGTPTRRSTATADTFGAAQARATTGASQFIGQVAENAERRLQEYHTTQFLTNLSNFELQATAGMQELANTVPADGGFPRAALEMFNKQAQGFMENVPNFLQLKAHEKVLGMRQNIAKAAVKMQETAMLEQTKQDFSVVLNNTANNIRFGNTTREEALQFGAEFIAGLPEHMKEGARNDVTAIVEQSTLLRLSDTNPEGTLAEIQSGRFNNLNPDFVNRVYDSAVKQIDAARNERTRLEERAFSLAPTDPVRAVDTWLAGNGLAPSAQNREAAIQSLGLNPNTMPVLPKQTAEQYNFRLTQAGNVNAIENILAEAYLQHGDQGVKDIATLGGGSPYVSDFVERYRQARETGRAAVNEDNQILVDAQMALIADPEAGKKALDFLNTRDSQYRGEIIKKINTLTEEDAEVAFRSGIASGGSIAESVEDVKNVLAVMVQQEVLRGQSLSNAVTAAGGNYKSAKTYVTVTDNFNAYTVPNNHKNTLSERKMREIKNNLIGLEPELYMSNILPSITATDGTTRVNPQIAELERKAMLKQSGWVMGPNKTYRLSLAGGAGFVSRGVPVKAPDGQTRIVPQPIELTLTELLELATEPADEGQTVPTGRGLFFN